MRPQRSPTDWSFTHYNLHGNQQVSLATVSPHSLLRHYRSESTGLATVTESRQVSVFDLLQGHHSLQPLTLSACMSPALSLSTFHLSPHYAIPCVILSLFLSIAASLHKTAMSPAFTRSLCCLFFPLPRSDLPSMDHHDQPNQTVVFYMTRHNKLVQEHVEQQKPNVKIRLNTVHYQ